MRTLAILAQKGGCGKSTIARNLAVAALGDGLRTAIIDADPQETCLKWRARREAPAPHVVGIAGRPLRDAVAAVVELGPDLIIIDTPPHLRGAVSVAAELADAVLLPSQPTPEDLEALAGTIAMLAGKPSAIVWNRASKGSCLSMARGACAAFSVPLCPHPLADRVAYPYSSAEGLGVIEHDPNSKASAEIGALWAWTKGNLLRL